MKRQSIRPRIGGAVYILPNMLTTGNLFFGYFSIIKSMQMQFEWAASAILLASIFDLLDGRVARLTGGTSEFGVQYDSLCDLVSFGMAPAFLMYQFRLHLLGRIGWILCFIFLACGALRLARFNVQSSIGKGHEDFIGLPIPVAAGVIACFIALVTDIDPSFPSHVWVVRELYGFFSNDHLQTILLTLLAPTLAFLMVSNVAYRSHKSVKITAVKPFRLLAFLVFIVGVAAYYPPLVGFFIFFGYAVSGIFEWVVGWKKVSDDDDIFATSEGAMEPSEAGEDNP